jgi:hypothetical protein
LKRITNIDERESFLAWNMLPYSIINGVMTSFHGKLATCIDQDGKLISHLIITQRIPFTYECLDVENYKNQALPFFPAEGNIIKELNSNLGTKCSFLQRFSLKRIDSELKNIYQI